MNLAETGTIDEDLDSTKSLITQALTLTNEDDMEYVISLKDDDTSDSGDTQQLPFEKDNNNMDASDTINSANSNLKIETLNESIYAPPHVTQTNNNSKSIRIELHDLRHKLTKRNTLILYARQSS